MIYITILCLIAAVSMLLIEPNGKVEVTKIKEIDTSDGPLVVLEAYYEDEWDNAYPLVVDNLDEHGRYMDITPIGITRNAEVADGLVQNHRITYGYTGHFLRIQNMSNCHAFNVSIDPIVLSDSDESSEELRLLEGIIGILGHGKPKALKPANVDIYKCTSWDGEPYTKELRHYGLGLIKSVVNDVARLVRSRIKIKIDEYTTYWGGKKDGIALTRSNTPASFHFADHVVPVTIRYFSVSGIEYITECNLLYRPWNNRLTIGKIERRLA